MSKFSMCEQFAAAPEVVFAVASDFRHAAEFIDGITFDGRKPNDYLKQFPIGLKGDQKVDGTKVVGG